MNDPTMAKLAEFDAFSAELGRKMSGWVPVHPTAAPRFVRAFHPRDRHSPLGVDHYSLRLELPSGRWAWVTHETDPDLDYETWQAGWWEVDVHTRPGHTDNITLVFGPHKGTRAPSAAEVEAALASIASN